MKFTKPFWCRQDGSQTAHYSYDDPNLIPRFLAKYGGTLVPDLTLPDQLQPYLDTHNELYSIIQTNPSPHLPAEGVHDLRRFQVLVFPLGPDQPPTIHSKHQLLREANTAAKAISRHFPLTLVIRKRVTQQ